MLDIQQINNTVKAVLKKSSIFDFQGSLTEIYGAPDSGKTNFVLQLVKMLSKENREFITQYVDADNKITYNLLQRHLLDTSRISFSFNVNSILKELDLYKQFADIVIIDSVSLFRNASMKLLMSNLSSFAKETNTFVFAINQLRHNFHGEGMRPYYDNVMAKFCDFRINLDDQQIYKKPIRHNTFSSAGNKVYEHSAHNVLSDLMDIRSTALNFPQRR